MVVHVVMCSGGMPVEPLILYETFGEKLKAQMTMYIPKDHIGQENE
tara:strand:+ start:225199 stop:225336 length:138 start_codon:yes stop_codon:yes gene_type:complete